MTTLLSVDVEDWFQVENLKQAISRESWDSNIPRVERNINLILELLDQNSTKATFFILGWIARKYPSLVKKIHKEGHEIASHGFEHDLIYNLTREKFKQDVSLTKNILEDLTGEEVIGYRAPSFSITEWAIEILMLLGYKYDSSLFPIVGHRRYGKLEKIVIPDKTIFELKKGFYQIMVSYIDVGKVKVPLAGGLYFRLIPYEIFKRGIKKIV